MHKLLHLVNSRSSIVIAIALTVPATALAQSASGHHEPTHATSTHRLAGHAACSAKDHRTCKPARRHTHAVHSEPASSTSRLHHHHSPQPQPGNPPTSTTPPTPSPPTTSTPPTTPITPSPPTPPVEESKPPVEESPPKPPAEETSPAPPAPPATPPPTSPPPPTTGEAPVLRITGTTYYVSPSGSDSNSGTSPAPRGKPSNGSMKQRSRLGTAFCSRAARRSPTKH